MMQIIDIGVSPNDGTGNPLRTGGQQINDNFEEVYGLLNNKVKVYNFYSIDWTANVSNQILAWINTNGLTVSGDEIVIFDLYKYYSDPNGNGFGTGDDFAIKIAHYKYIWSAGEGAFGTALGNTWNTPTWYLLGSSGEQFTVQYDLGEIGVDEIQDVVNESGPYNIVSGQTTMFIATRDAEEHVYIYAGNFEGEIGLGGEQTVAEDYIDLTEQQPDPIDPNDFVTQVEYSAGFYDYFKYQAVATVTDLSALDQKFYILKATNTNLYYFASKSDNVEEFEGSRIYLKPNMMKIDIGTMIEGDGYNLWQISDYVPFVIANIGDSYPFKFWRKKSGETDFNGNRQVTRSGVPNINVGGATVIEFLNNYFFPAVQPIVGLTNVTQSIEKGSNIEDMTVNISFTQNDAGDAVSFSLEKDGVEISTTQNNSIDETNIVAPIEYQGFVTYAEGTGIDAGTASSPVRTITPRLYMWYGAASDVPTTSAGVRALGDDVWNNVNTMTLNTGTTRTKFIVAVPSSKTTVASLSAQDITNNIALTYDFQNTVTVDLPTGTEEYRIYALSVDNAYPSNAQHKISI